MESSSCKISDADGVRLVTFARPEARNAFNSDLRAGMQSALEDAHTNDEIKAVVLTGEGSSFTAGVDLKELAALRESSQKNAGASAGSASSGNASPRGTSWEFMDILRDYTKPILMAVNGAGVGLGTTILGFADIAVAAESARFKCPFTELGVGAEASSTWLLPHLVGWQNAAWLLLSSEWIDSSQAKQMGLVHDVVPDSELLETTMGMAKKIASHNLDSIMAIKQTMNAWRTEHITQAAKLEGKRFTELLAGTYTPQNAGKDTAKDTG